MNKKKGTHIVKRLFAVACAAVLVLGLAPGGIGIRTVKADDTKPVNETYDTIKDAIKAGVTDITLTGDTTERDELTSLSKAYVIDLNGHTATWTDCQYWGLTPQIDGSLTIKDSVGGGTMVYPDTQNALISTWKTVTIEGGQFDAAISMAGSISGGTFNKQVSCAGNNITLNITGGIFNGDVKCAPPSWLPAAKATINITGGNFSGAVTCEGENCTISITGGCFKTQPSASYIASGYEVIDNMDSATKAAYPYKVVADRTETVTTLSPDKSITETYGTSYTLTAQTKAGADNVEGAVVAYYTDEECTTGRTTTAPTNAGTYYARGEFAGNDSYKPSQSDVVIKVTIRKAATTTLPDARSYTMSYGSASPVTAKVYDNNDKEISGAEITFTYSDSSGEEVEDISAADVGVYYVKGSYAGSDNYAASNFTLIKLTITKANQTMAFQSSALSDAYDANNKILNELTKTAVYGDVTYTSSNTEVATVNASTGEVTMTGVDGVTTITATAAGTTNYNEATASYTITNTKKNVSAPVISSDGQPTNASVKSGETATFTVKAVGDGLTYQWQIDRNDGKSFVNIDGATAASYTTSAVDVSCNGYKYHCIVTNTAGSVTTNDVTLTVTSDEPEVHKHTLVHHDTVAATTTTPGTKEYWQCSGCGKYFSDAEGKNEISAPETIPVVKPDEPTDPTKPVEKDNVVKVGDDENSGTLTVESDIDSSAPATTVATKASNILSILEKDGTLTAAEIADIAAGNSDVEVILGVKNNKDSITEASRNLIKEKADAEGMTIAEYMDITLTKYIIPTGSSRDQVTGTKIEKLTNGSIAITVTIPDAFKNTDTSKTRTYYVLRNHDNAVSVLNGTLSSDGNEFTFTTDKFSDYVLAYKDTAKSADDGGNNSSTDTNTAANTTTTDTTTTADSPKTGDSTPVAWLFVLLFGSAAGLFAANGRKLGRKRQ